MLCRYNCVFQIRLGAGRSTHGSAETAVEKDTSFIVDGVRNDRLPKDGGVSIYINNIVYKIKTLGGNKYINIDKVHGNREEFNDLRGGYHQYGQDHTSINNDNNAWNESDLSENGVDWTKSNSSLGSGINLSKISENYIDTTSEGSGSSISEEAVETSLKNILSSDEGDGRKINETNDVPNIKETDKHYRKNARKINTKHKLKSKSISSNNANENDIAKTKNWLKSKDESKSNNKVNDKLSATSSQSYKNISHQKANYTKDERDIKNQFDETVLQEKDVKASDQGVNLLLKSTAAKTITKNVFGAKPQQ